MKTKKVFYVMKRYEGKPVQASKAFPYEIQLQARLILDEICFNFNKEVLQRKIDLALEKENEELFHKYSEIYKQFVWE